MTDRNPNTRPSSEALSRIIKEIYKRKNKQNAYIPCSYNCLYSIKNLTILLNVIN